MKTKIILLATLLLVVSQGAYAQTEQNMLQRKLDSLQKTLTKELNLIAVEKRKLQMAEYDAKTQQIINKDMENVTMSQAFSGVAGAGTSAGTGTGITAQKPPAGALVFIPEEVIQRRQFELQQREDEIKKQLEALQKQQ